MGISPKPTRSFKGHIHHSDNVQRAQEAMIAKMSAAALNVRPEAITFGYNGFKEVEPSYPNPHFDTESHDGKQKATHTDRATPRRHGLLYGLGLLAVSLFVTPVQAVMVPFQNCLPEAYQNNVPKALQFVPLFVEASFDTKGATHNLHVTVYGNVTGSYKSVTLPPANDPAWRDPEIVDGKIENLPAPYNKYTTLFNKIDVLTYQPWSQNVNFCDQLVNGTCPLAPAFSANMSEPSSFPSFSMSNNMGSSYAFTSLTATFLIINGDSLVPPTNLGCISAEVTPDMGSSLSGILTFIPLAVLILVGVATAFAGVLSPWGTSNLFKWTTNYGRDADLLRLVTPGFGDCLQYIQFVTLTGGLTLSYPGFYQPIVSKVAWSTLMFNESFVTNGNGTTALIDGLYITNGTYGLENMSQLVGMTAVSDIWAGMAIWLLVILGAVTFTIQVGFFLRWAFRRFSQIQEEDLQAKNMPFTVGNVIRFVFSYFLLPIASLSMFQFVVAGSSPPATVAMAAVLLLTLIGFAGWLLYVVASTRPRSFLFDDLRTVLLYGPLYNTYSDDAAPFALVPVLLTFIRGIAIGAVQPSGIAQIVLLAICEVITILTLHAFRPFHSPTSMNAYHTFFAAVRFTSILLMVAFAPSLGVTDGTKAWIGYAILLLHAIVLIFGFLLNALQTIVEVVARLAGVGVDDNKGFAKVFGMRQLSRRLPRGAESRLSQSSNSAMLGDRKSSQMVNGGLRTQSAGSGNILLDGPRIIDRNSSASIQPTHLDGNSAYTPTTTGEASAFSFLPSVMTRGMPNDRVALLNLSTSEAADPYYRPPRVRRPTLEAYSPGARSRGSWASGDWGNKILSQPGSSIANDAFEGPSISGRATPAPSFAAALGADRASDEHRRSKTDYTTREVDFYYGVRGPALNANVPNRRLRTGPVDPTNPVTVASGWFKNLLGGKTKEKGKGFEVVRSSRMPPGMDRRNRPGHETPPEGIPIAAIGAVRRDLDDDEPTNVGRAKDQESRADSHILPKQGGEASDSSDDEDGEEEFEMTRISDVPPWHSGSGMGKGLEMSGDLSSKAGMEANTTATDESIPVPRKSSKRLSHELQLETGVLRQPAFALSSASTPGQAQHNDDVSRAASQDGNDPSSEEPLISINDDSSSALSNLDSHTRHDRPTSVGLVQHHPIRVMKQSSRVDLTGSAAEIVHSRPSDASRRS